MAPSLFTQGHVCHVLQLGVGHLMTVEITYHYLTNLDIWAWVHEVLRFDSQSKPLQGNVFKLKL